MANVLSIQNLIPSVSNQQIVQDKLRNSTFIGIDFGTSITVVSYTVFGSDLNPIKTDEISSTTGKNNEKMNTVLNNAALSVILMSSNFLNSCSSLLKT